MNIAKLAFMVLMISVSARAQLPDKLEPKEIPPPHLHQMIRPGEIMASPSVWPDDMVIRQRKEDGKLIWEVVEVNSCEWCGRPLTWSEAALDKKIVPLWLFELGLAIADTEITVRSACLKEGTCREGNPLLGSSRGQQYGVRMPLLALAWVATAGLRKGDKSTHQGGMRHWWVYPLIYQGLTASAVARNLTR